LGDLRVKRSLLGLAVTATVLSGAASAADLPTIKEAPIAPTPDWIVTFAPMVGVAPTYPGAKTYSFWGLPGGSLRRSDQPERFSSPDDSFSIAFFHNEWFDAGAAGRWIGARDVKNNPALFGMSDVNWSIEIGGYAEVFPIEGLRLRGEVRQAVTGYDGLAASAIADLYHRWGPLTLSIGPRLEFGNDTYAKSFFSVTPFEAALNQLVGGRLTPYNATGGLTAAGGVVAARYEINETWRVSGYGEYESLTGSVANSPLVKHTGSPDQFSAGIEIAYRFHTGALNWLPAF
jgi:outer membrane scaffolding protein for murein synthesis (MipA/OmpV family)